MTTRTEILASGFGGQGVVRLGQILGEAAVKQGYRVSMLKSHGTEMRGGYVRTQIVFSKEAIDSPMVEAPDCFAALSLSAYKAFKHLMKKGTILYDPAFVVELDKSLACAQEPVPAKDLSIKNFGNPVFANTIMLGALANLVPELDPATVLASILDVIPKYHEENRKAFDIGAALTLRKKGTATGEASTGGKSAESRPWFGSWPAHLPRTLEYPSVPASWILERERERFAKRKAIVFLDHENLEEIESLTYGDLWRKSAALAAGLRGLGVRQGDCVAALLPNSPAIVISYYGIWLAGASITPCNAMAKDKELEYQLKDSGARVLIAADTLAKMAAPVAEKLGVRLIVASVGETVDTAALGKVTRFEDLVNSGKDRPSDVSIDPAQDTAVLLYTGGTTGDPKGAILTHRNIVANTMQFGLWYDLKPGAETCVCTIPMSHSGGMSGVMNVPLFAGATLIVMKRFLPESVARVIEKYRATRFFGVPTMYVSLLNSEGARKCDFTSLKACRTNAAPLPVAVKEAFDKLVGKEVLVEGYGLTETSPLTHANPLQRTKAGSIGIPLPDTDCRVVDLETGKEVAPGAEGELIIRGPQVMKAYRNKPEATAKALRDGWCHTGDVVRMDEDGYFFMVDRLKDMIICGGYKVWPREVEEILFRHPQVRQAMVIGVADSYYGEVPKAYVVPKEGAGQVDPEELKAFCKKSMAAYKMPRVIEVCESLPVSPAGKVLKRLMREKEKAQRGK